ncbi:G-D-S-L family lipolytic protein [Sphaerospermopsis aphanizomenoides BCCUSP55]|uniref:SGNH/GDSL hydrolase family protein n=1 Tax=Sphaerospermopsis aphanizomenoides TaxID=459663 RepID=UPI000B1CCBAA|nr:SGNH/GDSL hydrolase family protein [Sphaerospermopsis aphanizomenoides]MBK1988115.1 G-D-S-L family lipolytic protein [Sphaerospermopsis aphanizomenoides BCCUSP55]
MKEPYLLAASLLTGLAVPTSAIPKMSSPPPENTGFLEDLKPSSQLPVEKKVPSNVDISLPEFSSQAVSKAGRSKPRVREKFISKPEFSGQPVLTSTSSQLKASHKVTLSADKISAELTHYVSPRPKKMSLNFSSQKIKQNLVTGSQLYYLRLASLKTGQIYTRVDDEDIQSFWKSSKKQKLSYEDWKSLLAMEARAISQGQGANRLSILVGDSLSMWFPKEKLPSGKLWLNQGISGDRSEGVLRRLSAFSITRPEVIYLMIGINDLLNGASDQTILVNHRRIISSLRQTHPKSQIMVQSILPVNRAQISNRRIRYLNSKIAVIAKQEGAYYLNIHNWFTDLDGNLRSDLTTDGLHLSPQGYDVWRFALQQIEYKIAQSL